jgi:serine/threonine-protein kinase
VACFDENALIDIARGRAARGGALAEVERHVATCDACARALAAVAEIVTIAGLGRAHAPPTTPPGLLPVGTLLNGTYRILRPIGRGGMGEVYEVAHARLAGRYALKVLSPEVAGDDSVLSRFKREAEITSALRHPNIVRVLDFDQTPEGRAYLAMEYLEGRHLGEVIAADGPLPLPRVLEIAAPVVSALAAIHDRRIVHRDLKPQNIMLVREAGHGGAEVVKLLDFGLSKRWGGAAGDSLLVSRERILLGTPAYMAPEQARGETDAVGPAADQFALGAIVYQMLTGRPPFAGDSVPTVLYQIVHVDPAPLRALVPDVGAGVEAVLRRALAKAPGDRFPSVGAFLEALRHPAAAAGDAGTPGPIAGEAPPSPPRPALARAVGVGLAAVLGAAIWWARPAPQHANAGSPTTVLPIPTAAIRIDGPQPASSPASSPAPSASPVVSGTRSPAPRHRRPPLRPTVAPAVRPAPAPAPAGGALELFDHL